MANTDIFGIERKKKKLPANTDVMVSEYAEELAGQKIASGEPNAVKETGNTPEMPSSSRRAVADTANEYATEMFGVNPKKKKEE